MKLNFTALFILLFLESFGQSNYLKGYFISNSNTRTECLIKNVDWKNNPISFEYKFQESDDAKTNSINEVEEFGIYEIAKYIKSTVDIDTSSDNIYTYSDKSEPIFNNQTVFLKVLVEGINNLYIYEGEYPSRFFYKNTKNEIKQLIYKKYIEQSTNINENNTYKGQLYHNVKCKHEDIQKIKKLKYEKLSLIKYFISTNECLGDINTKETSITKKTIINFKPTLLINNSKLKSNIAYSLSGDYDLGNNISLGFGFEAEVILPYNNYNWSVFIEPTYNTYKGNTISIYRPEFIYPNYEISAQYNYFQFPIGIRRNFFVFENSKIKADLILNYSLSTKNSNLLIDRIGEGSINPDANNVRKNINTFNLYDSRINLAFGFTYEYKKLSLSYRYFTKLKINDKNISYNTYSFSNSALVFNYKIFSK